MRKDRSRVGRRGPISPLLRGVSPDSLLIHSLMEEPLQSAHSNQLRSGGVLPHNHYLSLTVLYCSSHRSSAVCWKSQHYTLSYHLFCSITSLFIIVSVVFCVPSSLFYISLQQNEIQEAAKYILQYLNLWRIASVSVNDDESVWTYVIVI